MLARFLQYTIWITRQSDFDLMRQETGAPAGQETSDPGDKTAETASGIIISLREFALSWESYFGEY